MNSDRRPLKSRKPILIAIVIAAVLVVAGLIYAATMAQRTPEVQLTSSTLIHGEGFLISISRSTPWDDFTIQLHDPSNITVSWTPSSSRLDKGITCNYTDGPKALGSLNVSCNITDLAGNGCVDQMDFFTLIPGPNQAFAAGMPYTVTIIYEPTATDVCEISFIA